MQTQTLENAAPQVLPYNDAAELLNREFQTRMLEQSNVLAREYEIKNPSQVAAFLSGNLFLLDLLKEIPAQIRKQFGTEQKIWLSFFLDPEDPGYHRLYVSIPTNLPVKEAMRLLDDFDADWWLAHERKSLSKILVDLEFLK